MKILENIKSLLSPELRHRLLMLASRLRGKSPTSHIIEISGACVAKCPYCPTSNSPDKTRKYMSPETFEKIIVQQMKSGLLVRKQGVSLYDYGDPFLHPKLNELLGILKKYRLRAGFSSNFIKAPDISQSNFSVISFVVFSLCGLTDETYRRIYGVDINRVLSNFESFVEQKRKYNDSIEITINWLRYKFNENQRKSARDYFTNLGCDFRPITAYINDVERMIELCEGRLDADRYPNLTKDMDTDKILDMLKKLANRFPDYRCPQHECILIDEDARLGLCCGVRKYSENFNLGDAFKMRHEELFRLKRTAPICKKCLTHGITQLIHEGFKEKEFS